MVGVSRPTIRAEREHGVGLHLIDQRDDARDRFLGIDIGAATVRVPQPTVIGHAENLERVRDLDLTDLRQLGRRPALRVGRFTTRRGDAHDAVPPAHCVGHDPGREVALVVRMRPHAEDGAEVRDHAPSSGSMPLTTPVSSAVMRGAAARPAASTSAWASASGEMPAAKLVTRLMPSTRASR